jgi:hypothetical protein
MNNILKVNAIYNYITMNSPTNTPTSSYFRYLTDKRLTPPYLKPYKTTKDFRKKWTNVINDFNNVAPQYQLYKKMSPLFHQIKSTTVMKAIKNFNRQTLRPTNENVLVSYKYTYNIIYKVSDTVYTNTSSNSFVSNLSSYNNSITSWKDEEEAFMTEQSPIRSYKITNIYEIQTISTNQSETNPNIYEDDEDDLEDFLDLELNGLPQYLFNNDNLIDDKTQIKSINLDDETSKIHTTTSWDTNTGRCVYDYLIHYYKNDTKMTSKLTYHKLFKYFNNKDLPNIKQTQIDIWEKENGKVFNDEIKLFWNKVVTIQEKYRHHNQEQISKLGKINKNEHNLIFTKIAPLVTQVESINVSDEYFKNDNNLGLNSKEEYIMSNTIPERSYKTYYKDMWSVSVRQIKRFCKSYGIPMYCLSQDDKTIAKYLPDVSHNNHKSLAFKVANGHFYGIEDSKTISYLGVINSKKTSLITNNVTKKSDKEPPKVNIIEVKTDKSNTQFLYETMKELNTQVLNKNIVMKGNQILSFVLGDNKYIFGNDNDDNFGKELLGDKWKGEHIVQLSSQIFKELYPKEDHKSSLNNQVLEYLLLEGVKHRTHLGAMDNDNIDILQSVLGVLIDNDLEHIDIVDKIFHKGDEVPEVIKPLTLSGHSYFDKWKKDKAMKERKNIPIKEPYYEDKVVGKDVYKCYDINKCYGAILQNPLEKWCVLDFNSIFLPFDTTNKHHRTIPLGLYTINTNDFTLFHGSNIYSRSIIIKGLEENIITHKNIKQICIANQTLSLPKNHFHKLIEKFKTCSNGNINMFKSMVNLMTGILGKSSSSHTNINISSSFNEFLTYISDKKDTKPFCYVEGDGDDKIYMYGVSDERQLQENSLPIYLQILDESNIRLYDMVKKSGGHLLYRKTDCALILNPTNELELDDLWGGYSKEKYPILVHTNKHIERQVKGDNILKHIENDIDKNWSKYDVNDSTDYDKVRELIEDKGGLMMLGRAGTGKSYVIKNIANDYKSEGKGVAKLAFTNIASLNIGGTTIHKFLKLNEKGDLLQSRINIIEKEYSLIIIDEISMVSSFLWRRLYHLHDLTKIPFLLVGDFRQIPPVEDMRYEDYRDHPTLLNLCKNSYIELEKIHRYDTALADITKDLDGMMNIQKSQFKKKIGKVNICYLNKTRKKINRLLNDKLRPQNEDDFVVSPMTEWNTDFEDDTPEETKKHITKMSEEEPTQDLFVYKDMPMIARLNQGDDIYNNEKFIVTSIGETITLMSIRASDEGTEEQHEFKCLLQDLQKYLLCCYCMTTHKSQGITIDGAVTIHDWDRMDKKLRYTAITRVKKLENIFMI